MSSVSDMMTGARYCPLLLLLRWTLVGAGVVRSRKEIGDWTRVPPPSGIGRKTPRDRLFSGEAGLYDRIRPPP
jgi:hypothetical protein